MNLDFTTNQRQADFIELILNCSEGNSKYRYICFGGGIRGGKTFAVLGALIILCKVYPKSKWVVYRQDMPSLTSTTIPSLEKIIGANTNWHWNRDKSNFHVTYKPTGATIYFYGENISQDPELNSMLGMECNGVVLEQAEELSEKLFQMAQSRVGSWIIDRMPKPLILLTLNPSQTWVKQLFYEKWQKGQLEEPYYFIQSLPNDNPHVTDEQWATWNRMHDRYKKQFIEGDWSDLSDKNNLWAFAFDRQRHIAKHLDPFVWSGNRNEPLYLSFDFNRNPITCSVIQHYNGTIFVLEQIKLNNSDIYNLCGYIKTHWKDYLYIVTGDATGKNSTAFVKDNLNFYKVIAEELRLALTQFKLPSVNPPLADNQVLVNSVLQHYNIQIHPDKGKALIYDLETVKMNADGSIVKAVRTDPSQQADCLDCFTGDTLINTIIGQKRIDEIISGDLVLTRTGYKPVIDKWNSRAMVYEVEFMDGTIIKCTKDHKFFTYTYGWYEIFRIFEENIQICKLQSFTTEESILNIPNNHTIIAETQSNIQDVYTGRNGLTILERYQNIFRYIIKMETLSIMKLKIMNWLKEVNTWLFMQRKDLKPIHSLRKSFKEKELKKLQNGIKVKMELNGIINTQKISHLENLTMDLINANFVMENLIGKQKERDSVLINANQHGEEKINLIHNNVSVPIVEKNIQRLNIYQPNIVLRNVAVKSLKEIGIKEVWDITVKDDHEFFAENILVHNCFRYYINIFHKGFLRIKESSNFVNIIEEDE